MHTSRFQLGLIATLALGLGFSMASSNAIGYPTGAISLGTNPLFATAGQMTGTASGTVLTAGTENTAVVTDVVLTVGDNNHNCAANMRVSLDVNSVTVGIFDVGLDRPGSSFTDYESILHLDLRSGIPVPPDQTMEISVLQISQYDCGGDDTELSYTVSGYYAQP